MAMKKTIIFLILLGVACSVNAQQLIHKYLHFPSEYVSDRTIEVLLPEGYDEEKSYPVLYMHDGQMLFDSNITWNKQEWGVDEVVPALVKENRISPVIVVGILYGTRYSEYMPAKPKELLDPIEKPEKFGKKIQSDEYLKFIVEELKPFIDKKYSTQADKENTFILGSSMGGLISCYAISEYPNVFGGAACISTHWPALGGVFLNYVESNLPDPKDHRIYFDYGTATLDSLYQPYQEKVDEMMIKRGYKKNRNWITRKFEGEKHDEIAWRKRLHIPLEFLLGTKKQE
jgi:predicted alpha/beta superfamily hydrolase